MAKKKTVVEEPVIAPKRGKKVSSPKEVAKSATKEIALKTDLLFEPAAPFEFRSNSPVVLAEIKDILAKYKKLKITDKNFDEATLVKRKVVTLRTMLTNRKKEATGMYCDPVKQKITTTFDTLLKEVNSLEKVLDAQFAGFDKIREDEIKEVCQDYIDELQETYKLPDDYLAMVELKKKYFNKGQKEKDTYDDLKSQFSELSEKHNEYLGNVKLIEREIEGEKRFNRDLLVEQLSYRSFSAVLQDIKAEKDRFAAIDKGAPVKKITVGAPTNAGLLGGKKVKKTVAVVRLLYAEDDEKEIFDVLNNLPVQYSVSSKEPAK